jgi:hypothetical protein
MEDVILFNEVLEAVGKLSLEEQETLLDIVQRRIAREGREMMREEIREARGEFERGECHAVTAEDLMKEICS